MAAGANCLNATTTTTTTTSTTEAAAAGSPRKVGVAPVEVDDATEGLALHAIPQVAIQVPEVFRVLLAPLIRSVGAHLKGGLHLRQYIPFRMYDFGTRKEKMEKNLNL